MPSTLHILYLWTSCTAGGENASLTVDGSGDAKEEKTSDEEDTKKIHTPYTRHTGRKIGSTPSS